MNYGHTYYLKRPKHRNPIRLGLDSADDTIKGVIIGFWIKPGYIVEYHVEWWDGRQRRTHWLAKDLFWVDDYAERTSIGFITPRE